MFRYTATAVIRTLVNKAPWLTAKIAADEQAGVFLYILGRKHHLRTVEFLPPMSSPLASGTSTIRLRPDFTICPAVLTSGAWQYKEVAFIKSKLPATGNYTLIDVGANVGLITRQVLGAIPAVTSAICFEPDADNFLCLQHNLKPFPDVVLREVALSEGKGSAPFFLDESNCGNFSLNPSAMDGRSHRATTVTTEDANVFFSDLLLSVPADRRFVYKSDTQGYDEFIASIIPRSFWDRVDLVIMELWRIAKPKADQAAFRRLIESFPNRRLAEQGGQASVAVVMDFAFGTATGKFDDLFLWR